MYVFNTNITDGTDQGQREPLAFRSGYFNVDEMSFEVLLSMASQYAEIFTYYNAVNQKKGSWAELFSANEAVIMALIATYDVLKVESTFRQLDTSNLQIPAEHVIKVAATLDFWLKQLTLAATESAAVLRSNIHDMIKANLLPGFHTAVDVAARSRKDRQAAEVVTDVRAFSPVWGVISDGEHRLYPHANRIDLDHSDAVIRQLESTLFKITGSIRYFKTLVSDMLTRSLKNQSHEPAIGLYMVFLRLYEVAQKRLNRFTARHLDFYYRTCLQTKPHRKQTESLFLRFEPTSGATEFIVDEHVCFSAKKNPSSGGRVYRLEQPLLVRRAKVSALYTLYFQRNALISPECELGHVTRIKSYERKRLSVKSELSVDPMSLFGSAKGGGQQEVSDSEIGFCIASPVLALKEGRRQIELSIHFTMPDAATVAAEFDQADGIDSAANFIRWFGRVFSQYVLGGKLFFNDEQRRMLHELVEKHGDDDGVYSALLKQSCQDLFYHLLSNSFAITLSGESGWLIVKDYLVTPIIENDSEINSGLKIILSLAQDVESVLPYDAGVHGGNRCCNVPMINVCLDSEAGFFSYSLLNSVAVKSVEIEVTVNEVKDLVISNHLGRLDPAKPFAPLGPNPSRNSYFVLGSREAAEKKITAMAVDLEWSELPTRNGGFFSHYEGYNFVPLNSDFKAELSVLQDGHWMPSDITEQHNVRLFNSNGEGVPDKERTLNIAAIDYFKPLTLAEKLERYEFHTNSRNGFVRFQLSSPDNAFAHSDYPQLVTRILSENVRRKKPIATPNAPYTPLIQKITLNYKARTFINMSGDTSPNTVSADDLFFHIHPFGVESVSPSVAKKNIRLLPVYNEDGNLFIGVDAQNLSGTLTLFFTLDDDISRTCASKKPAIHWRCLTAAGWLPLDDSRVRSDTTEGFIMSGVVTLDLPQGMINNSLLMPQGQYWLHVAVNEDLQRYCGLRSVFCNVGQISCAISEEHHNDDSDQDVANDGWRTVKSVPGLDKVSRIGQVSGGRPAENEGRYRARISERLRHKGRASTAWDYERLILEHFPDVYKVKCFANTVCHKKTPQPGHVLIVVVPYMEREARINCERGRVNGSALSQIQSFIQKIASPFARIEVRNPLYEQIQVRCTVKFAGDNRASGLYINRLNQDISDYICPWCDVGYKENFGWEILGDDIESYIRELDYIDFVTNFSILHISEKSEEKYFLEDSATRNRRHEVLITPRYPWSLAVPMRRHSIESTTSTEPVKAKMTGINELAIGSTFIIGGS